MNTPPQPPGRIDENDDPTGVHELLSSLPSPGPMPADLVARIQESLRAEAEQGDSLRSASAVGLLPLRRTRRSWRPLLLVGGVAAASLALIAVVGVGALQSRQGQAALGTAAVTAHTQPGQPVAGSAPAATTSVGDGSSSPSTPGGVRQHIQLSSTAYDAVTLREQARRLSTGPSAALGPLQAEFPSVGPIGTPLGLASCLRALGLSVDVPVVLDLATYEKKPAAVLVTTDADGRQEVRVVERSCSEGRPGLIVGPYGLS